MTKKNAPKDINQIAFDIVAKATNDPPTKEQAELRSQAAAILGRLGGLKGGPARAAKLSPKKRREIAKKAIAARWAKAKKK